MLRQNSFDPAKLHIVKALIAESAFLLDVRTHCEHAGYHVKGAINIPYDEIELLKPLVAKWDKPIIIFSTHGRRSKLAAQQLKSWGKEAIDAGSMYLVEKALEELNLDHNKLGPKTSIV